MACNPLWQVAAGRGDSYLHTIRDSSGTALTLTGSETLEASAWVGDDIAEVSGLITIAHSTPASGIVRSTVVDTVTATLTPAFYRVELSITLNSVPYTFHEGWLEIQDFPGAATEPPVYGTLQDMLDLGGDWLVQLLTSRGRANFLAARKRAREWFDSCFLSRCRDYFSYVDLEGPFLPWMQSEADNTAIVGYLAADQLIVSGDVREAVACKAIAFACEAAIAGGSDDPWPARARRFHARARKVLSTSNPGIDTDADGEPDIVVNMGYFSLR